MNQLFTLYCGACKTAMTYAHFDESGCCPVCGNGTVEEISPSHSAYAGANKQAESTVAVDAKETVK